MTWVERWPATLYRQTVDGDAVTVDIDHPVEAYQLRPDLLAACVAWAGGEIVDEPGSDERIVRIPAGGPAAALGDFAVRDGDSVLVEPAAGFWQRFIAPADIDDEAPDGAEADPEQDGT